MTGQSKNYGWGLLVSALVFMALTLYLYGKPYSFYDRIKFEQSPTNDLRRPFKYDPHTFVTINYIGWFGDHIKANNRLEYYRMDYDISREELRMKTDSIIKER